MIVIHLADNRLYKRLCLAHLRRHCQRSRVRPLIGGKTDNLIWMKYKIIANYSKNKANSVNFFVHNLHQPNRKVLTNFQPDPCGGFGVKARKEKSHRKKHRHTIVRRFFNWLLDPVLVINHSVGISLHVYTVYILTIDSMVYMS